MREHQGAGGCVMGMTPGPRCWHAWSHRRGTPIPLGLCFNLDWRDGELLSPRASSALKADPIKVLPGHGGLFLVGTAPASTPAPFPPPPPAHIPLPKFRFSILFPQQWPQPPWGEQKRNPWTPLARQGARPRGVGDRSPQDLLPVWGSASCRSMGAERVVVPGRKCRGWGRGLGPVHLWRNVFLPCGCP